MRVMVSAGYGRRVATGAWAHGGNEVWFMEKMDDGSPMLPVGTYVRVDDRGCWDAETGDVIFPPETYIAKIVGTDLGRSKYEVGQRYPGWGKWCFMEGGGWAFIGEVTEISEQEALRSPTAQQEVSNGGAGAE